MLVLQTYSNTVQCTNILSNMINMHCIILVHCGHLCKNKNDFARQLNPNPYGAPERKATIGGPTVSHK